VARVPYLHRDQAGDHAQSVFERLEAERRMPTPNIFLALAHAPRQLDALLSYSGALRASDISPRLRELVILTVADVTGCDYEAAHHQSPALAAGLTPEQLKAVSTFETSDVFDNFDKAVMRFAAQFSSGSGVCDEVWEAVATHHTTEQMVQLTLLIAWYVSGAFMMRALKLDLEPGYSLP
jgi:AhpD family alkylhydroperoxidase